MKYDLDALNEQFGEAIGDEYLNGTHASELASKYLGNKNDYAYIFSILKKQGIQKKTRSEVKLLSDKKNPNPNLNGRKFFVNDNFFKIWTKDMAYMLGYIATDGCVSEERVLRFGLAEKDESLLYKIKEVMDFTGNVYRRIVRANNKEYVSSYMNIYNRKVVKDLKTLGITSAKTFTLGRFDFVPKEFEMDFIRGVFDGDGSVGANSGGSKVPKIRVRFFSASLEFITYIRDTMTNHDFKEVSIYKDKKRKNDFYYLTYQTSDAIKFYNMVYQDTNLFIDRKKEKFEELIEDIKKYENSVENQNRRS